MSNIAIITARSGSKGLKDKNIRELAGMPLMAYSIQAALQTHLFSSVMVSTDSEKYADIAREFGAEVPFLRSAQTSADTSSSWDVVEEVLNRYEEKGQSFDTFCLLQPTSPLRDAHDILGAYQLYDKNKAFAIVSMTPLEHPIEWCGIIDENLSLNGFSHRDNDKQRQVMKQYYRPNGAIYIASVSEFRKDNYLYREGAYAYIMSNERSVDIDNEFDFRYAEFLLEMFKTNC